MATALDDHEQIITALLGGDNRGAEQLLETHIAHARAGFLEDLCAEVPADHAEQQPVAVQ